MTEARVFRLRLLGGAAIHDGDGPLTGPVAQRRRLALLALLAAAPAGAASRERLAALLFPECDADRARHGLTNALHAVRRVLGKDAVVAVGDELRLNADIVRSDLGDFEAALEARAPERAAVLYRGPFLDGFGVPDTPELERWTEAERQRLGRAYAGALEAAAAACEARSEFSEAAGWWRRLAAHDPYSSRVAVRTMRALAAAGDPAEALRHARVHEALVRDGLGVEPAAELAAAEREIQRGTGRDYAPTPTGGGSGTESGTSCTAAVGEPGTEPLAGGGPHEPPADPAPAAPGVAALSAIPTARTAPAGTGWRHRLERRGGPVRAAFVIVVLAVVALLGRGSVRAPPATADATRIPSLAVLPLENLSGDATQDYFVAGMHGALVGELARTGGLRVVSRTSALRYRNSGKSVPVIARELRVNAVLEGAVLRVGDSVRVQVRLFQARSAERNLWSQTYDRHVRDALAVHTDIARAVARTMDPAAAGEGTVRRAGAHSVDPRAYDAYLRGRYYWSKRTETDLERALAYFRQALDHDPTFAPAYAGMGDAYVMLGSPSYAFRRPAETYPPARAAAERALRLDSTLADAHVTLGQVASAYDRDWRRAEQSFRTAVALDPGYPTARHWYSLVLVSLGRTEEALREAQHARELDPLTPGITGNAARVAYFARRYDDAVAGYRTTIELGSSSGWPHVGIAMARAAQGRYGPALAELDPVQASFGGLTEAVRAYILARAGRPDTARRILTELVGRSREEYVAPLYIGIVYGALGERDRAFEWIGRAVRERDGMLRFVKVEPMLDPLRSDARFDVLLRRLGLQ